MKDIEAGMKIILDAIGVNEKDLDERQLGNVEEFVRVTVECDDEILAAIDHQIQMTYPLYQRTVDTLQKLKAERTLKEFVEYFGKQFTM